MPRRSVVLGFLIVFSSLVVMSTVTIYTFLVQSFSRYWAPLTDPWWWALFLFTMSFVGATLYGNYQESRISRLWYHGSALWIGGMVYALFGSLGGLIIQLAFGPVSHMVVGTVVTTGTIAFCIYGATRARMIEVTSYTVPIPGLPRSWDGRRMVWLSDTHFGQIYGPDRAQRIVERVHDLHPDIVCIIGDMFDGTRAIDLHACTRPFAQLHPPHGVYFVTGNHEEFGPVEPFLEVVKEANMRILMDECIEIDGVQLIGVDYKHAESNKKFSALLDDMNIDRDRPSILLKHEPLHITTAAKYGISLQLSGHTHYGQMWPILYITQWAYRGYAYGLKMCGSMKVIVSSGAGTWGPPMRIGTKSEIVHVTFISA